MIKYLGRKGYTVYLKDIDLKQVKEDLTFTPFTIPGYGSEQEPFKVYGISKEKAFLPKFYGIEKFGQPEVRIGEGEKIHLQFKGDLRSNQIEPIEACLKAAHETGGGILCLPCGYGKTACALYIIAKLGVKTLIVVKNDFLMTQWKERIAQFLPEAKIGIIKQKKVEIDNDIVIGMLQSISMKDYGEIYSSFGAVFYDEVHGVPSRVFSKALRKIQTRYHFGLSATPNRADGMTKVTKLFIGPIIYKITQNSNNPKNVKVFTVSFDKLPETKYYKQLLNYRKKPDIVRMISNKIKCPQRLDLLTNIITYFADIDKRHILVLSKRIQYLRDIEKKLPKTLKIGYYIGGMKDSERKESETSDVLLASYDMAKEAMDIPILDSIIMVTSFPNIEQATGRIQRKTEYPIDKPPLIIDFVDNFSSFQRQAIKRLDFYRKKSYPVYDFTYDGQVKNLFNDFEKTIKTFSLPDIFMDELYNGNTSQDTICV
jgi:superfamily II DNA or RNA helicase